jgi:hypothetical protein
VDKEHFFGVGNGTWNRIFFLSLSPPISACGGSDEVAEDGGDDFPMTSALSADVSQMVILRGKGNSFRATAGWVCTVYFVSRYTAP